MHLSVLFTPGSSTYLSPCVRSRIIFVARYGSICRTQHSIGYELLSRTVCGCVLLSGVQRVGETMADAFKGSYCSEHKVLEGISFINWIQCALPYWSSLYTLLNEDSVMLYANTLMTVATICHVRKRPVWLRRVTELPTFSAPALTFGPRPDFEFDSVFMVKSNESTLGDSTQPEESRGSHQYRSRIAFPPPHPSARPGVRLSASSSPRIPLSESTTSLVHAVSQSDAATPQNTTSYPSHRMVTTGEPPTYSAPASTYELVTV